MLITYYVLVALALVAMSIALGLALKLRRVARGGRIGRVVSVMLAFVALFTVAYAVAPFAPDLPAEGAHLLTGIVFLFGALFVIIVLRVLDSLVRQVMDELDLQ